jgi:hypothetical protein
MAVRRSATLPLIPVTIIKDIKLIVQYFVPESLKPSMIGRRQVMKRCGEFKFFTKTSNCRRLTTQKGRMFPENLVIEVLDWYLNINLLTHESVDDDISKTRMTCKAAVLVLQQMLNILRIFYIANPGKCEFCVPPWEQAGESQRKKRLGTVELQDRSARNEEGGS